MSATSSVDISVRCVIRRETPNRRDEAPVLNGLGNPTPTSWWSAYQSGSSNAHVAPLGL